MPLTRSFPSARHRELQAEIALQRFDRLIGVAIAAGGLGVSLAGIGLVLFTGDKLAVIPSVAGAALSAVEAHRVANSTERIYALEEELVSGLV